jgi:pseudaminic acid cytidylyltransferase
VRLAVIPARGGSKRIPKKNIKTFMCKPIIAWSIEAALQSRCFDHVIVSTDDSMIAEVAQCFGASVPFMRPDELSDDHTATIPVVRHAIEWFMAEGAEPAEVCCIYATAPFVRAADLCEGLDLLMAAPDCNYTFSVTSYPFPIQRAIRITDKDRVEMFNADYFNTRSQDLEEAWHDAGQFYWGRAKAWLAGEPVFSPKSIPFRLPRNRVQDIDTPEDWTHAEWLFKSMQKQS